MRLALRALGVCLVGLVAMLVAGCYSQRDAHATYLSRLATALEQPLQLAAQNAPETTLALFPAPNTLVIERPVEKIDLLDFLQVHRCEMGALVGARNSSLGRVQSASQRWLYDLQLVQGLRACTVLTPELQGLLARRELQLGAAAFNALFSGKEWHAFATPGLSVPAQTPAAGVDAAGVERALLSLTAMVEASHTGAVTDNLASSLEANLAQLKFSAALGQQRAAWARQTATLENATRMLVSALQTNPACRNGKPTPAGRIRQNVFQQFYVNGVQDELARQGQADRGWVKAIGTLVTSVVAKVTVTSASDLPTEAQTPGQALAVERWHDQVLGAHPSSEFGRWRAALAAHSQAWQRQLSLCGLMPALAVQRPI